MNTDALAALADHLLMSMLSTPMKGKDYKDANNFLHDRLVSPIRGIVNIPSALRRSRLHAKVFIPPKPEDRVLMFADKSGVYVYNDGFCTPMGEDISEEVLAWEETN